VTGEQGERILLNATTISATGPPGKRRKVFLAESRGFRTDAFHLTRKNRRERTSKELATQLGSGRKRTLSQS
jgi:hypothetical protein